MRVRSPQTPELARALAAGPTRVEHDEPDVVTVHGMSAAAVGEVAAANGIVLHELTPTQVSLEEAFMAMTEGDLQNRSAAPDGGGPRAAAA